MRSWQKLDFRIGIQILIAEIRIQEMNLTEQMESRQITF